MTAQLPGSTHLIRYCQNCRKSCKVQPPTEEPSCRCKQPVPGLHPTEVTIATVPTARRLHIVDEEEGRLRALARKGTKVRVTITYEGEIADAWQWSSADRRGLGFIVATPDGQRHDVDPQRAGVHVEAVDGTELT